MRIRRWTVGALASVLLFTSLLVPSLVPEAQAQAADARVCIELPNGTIQTLDVADSAVDAHIARGAAQPGQPVPGNPDFLFDADCELVPANQPPVANDDTSVVSEDVVTSIDVTLNDTDPNPGDVPTITAVSTPARGATSIVGNQIAYDPLGAFDLALGETEALTFTYEITDSGGLTDSATVTLTVVGDGPAVVSANAAATLPNSGQNVSITLTGSSTSSDGTGAYDTSIGLGAVVQPRINVVYVVDTSGSTIAEVLDAEVAALKNLTAEIVGLGFPDGSVTVSIVPFSTTADPDATGNGATTTVLDSSDDVGATDEQIIAAELDALVGGGFTNYVEALDAADDIIDGLELQFGEATNLIYFLSDGQPTVRNPVTGLIETQSVVQIAAAVNDAADGTALIDNARISAFEIGIVDALEFLDALDNTGGAESIENPSDLTAALLGSPVAPGSIVSATMTVTNADGVETVTPLAPGDFIETPLGLELTTPSVPGFSSDLGAENVVQLEIGFDDDNDGVADTVLTVAVTVFGTG